MRVDAEDVADMVERLEEGRRKLGELRQERDALLRANKLLVQLVEKQAEKLEDVLTHYTTQESGENGERRYDFENGWKLQEEVHRDALEVDNPVDIDRLERQIGEVIKTLNNT